MKSYIRNSLQWRKQADRLREEYRAETDAEKKAEAGVRLLECLYCFEEMHVSQGETAQFAFGKHDA